jgi:multidrug efflux pump subunit AcrA (membrane-fusion protein)
MRAWLIILVLIVSASAAGYAYWARQTLDVPVGTVVKGQAVEAVYATGTVEAENRVTVKARTAGSLLEVLVKPGSSVKRGDLLARIDNRSASLDLERGKVDLRAASVLSAVDAPELSTLSSRAAGLRAELAAAQSELTRVRHLVERGAFPSTELDRVRVRVESLNGSLAANEAEQRGLRVKLDSERDQKAAQVSSLGARLAEADVRAPLDGVVLVRQVEPGEVVSVNQPLFVVGDCTSFVLELSVDESDIARVHDGATGPASEVVVSLPAYPERRFVGHVFEILPEGDRVRKTFLAKVRLQDPPLGLRSGMTSEVNVIVRARPGLLAPASAESEGFAWIVRGGRAHRVAVEVGIRDPLQLEILSGLREGDQVVIESGSKLSEGQQVRAISAPARTPKPAPVARAATAPAGGH